MAAARTRKQAGFAACFVATCFFAQQVTFLASAQGSRVLPVSTQPTFVLDQFQPGQPMRLITYGDMRFCDPAITKGTNPRVRQWLAEKIGAEKPEALLLTGDIPFVGERSADWDEFQRETASWHADGFPVFPAPGNHEVYYNATIGIANYLRNFPKLEGHLYYSALLGSVEVISLDMNQAVGPRSAQGRWFAGQLEHLPPTVEFLLIQYHMPWVADTQSRFVADLPSKDALALRSVLEAHLSRMRARVVVINGHIHNYERFEVRGVEYLISGGGGAEPYPLYFRGSHDLYRDPAFPVYHYLTLEVADHELKGTMWKVADPKAETLTVEKKDEFTIRAAPAAPAKKGKKP
jgi:hypothetical protein